MKKKTADWSRITIFTAVLAIFYGIALFVLDRLGLSPWAGAPVGLLFGYCIGLIQGYGLGMDG